MRLLSAAGAAAAILAVTACGPADTTQARLEAGVAPTFGRLYALQESRTDAPAVTLQWSRPSANCQRHDGGTAGAGDWTCAIAFRAADGVEQRAVLDVQARPGGCYVAVGPPEAVGAVLLRRPDGRRVRNPLARFEGCLDTT